jgi:uncharacterized membrane protein
MKRIRQNWTKMTGWMIPLVYATTALTVGMIFPRIEAYFLPHLVSTMSPLAAISMCSAIASGMLALTGIVFSLTFLMIQFSATAYSPRLVLWLAHDPVLTHALGVFIATFLYALAMLGWVDRGATGKVPLISAWMVVVLLVASMGMFIALIDRVGLLQVNRMLVFTGEQGRTAINEMYIPFRAAATSDETGKYRSIPVTQTLTYVGRPKVIQAVRTEDLVGLAAASDAIIELTVAVGDTVVETTPLLSVRGARQPLVEQALLNMIEIGDERTFEQDPKYAIRLVVDIAIKALSPAINDPTTAVQALDQIEDLLLRLGRQRLDIGNFHDPAGRLRLVVPFPTWDDFLLLGLDEIRAYGADSVQVMRRMKALTKSLLTALPTERHSALRHWEQRLQGSIARSFADAEEQRDASVADRQGLGLGQGEAGGRAISS